ncbi:MAG: VanZ family protein [Candidatus Omnitrophica bacterium]|nr:VanZ family protein [Candidatus Omnitrophota bacterium]
MIKGNNTLYYWLQVLVWLEFIFILSSIPSIDFPPMPSDSWQFWAHRVAHFGEYSVLGVLLFRAYSYKRARVGVITILLLSMHVFLAGSLDEWHQSFVPGRNCQFIDAIFDTISGAFGMLAYLMWLKMAKLSL